MFTGSAPYREILNDTLHPAFLAGMAWNLVRGVMRGGKRRRWPDNVWRCARHVYPDGAVIVREGEPGDCMFVVQAGQVEVIHDDGGHERRFGVISEGGFFGEMAIFETEMRSATVRAWGDARVSRSTRRCSSGASPRTAARAESAQDSIARRTRVPAVSKGRVDEQGIASRPGMSYP